MLAFKFATYGQALCGNTDDRKPFPDMTQDIIGKLFGDRDYISQSLFEQLYHRGLNLITRRKKNMKQQLVKFWLAGSRSHVTMVFIEQTLVMLALYFIGADRVALDIYVAIAALQAIVIHSNLGFGWGWLKYIIVTPQYHHWHHSSEEPAIDTNYAAHTPLFDRLFGTYHLPKKHWSAEYGTTKKLLKTFIGQFIYPFKNLIRF